ncbi:hypothetical protein ACO1O0_007160 [Amphichorda felina]
MTTNPFVVTDVGVLRKYDALYACVEVPRYHVVFRMSPDHFVDSPNSLRHYRSIYTETLRRVDKEKNKVRVRSLIRFYIDRFYFDFSPPAPRGDNSRLTLADIQAHAVVNCFFFYRNEHPIFQGFSYSRSDELLELPLSWATDSPFPIFNLGQVEIPPDELGFHETRNQCANDFSPVRVTLGDTSYFYQPILFERDESGIYVERTIEDMESEVDQYLKIESAGLSCDELGILLLRGIVVNNQGHVKGLLKEWRGIRWQNFLNVMLHGATEENSDVWINQCSDIVRRTYQAGLDLGPFDVRDMAFDQSGNMVLVHLVKGQMQEGAQYFSVTGLTEPELLLPFIEVVAEAELQREMQGRDEESNTTRVHLQEQSG